MFISYPNETISMSDPFLGEIRLFAGNYAPYGWAFCDGQIMQIVQNSALYSILGTTYGGDGKTTFALPNLKGRIPLHFGRGDGLTNHELGEAFGSETVTLTANQMPEHSHSAAIKAANAGTTNLPQNNLFGKIARSNIYSTPDASLANMAEGSVALANSGGSQPHSNMQPYLTMSYIIAIYGIYPIRG
jgi:microcystin-dependent protein